MPLPLVQESTEEFDVEQQEQTERATVGQLSNAAATELRRQGYRVVGNHSAVKVCGWTKNMIKNKGGCYKLRFYGIMSNQCMQMTTSISCANRCTFCWRGYKAPVSKEWKWSVDEPQFIVEHALHHHYELLQGFGTSNFTHANKKFYEQSKSVQHVALSLTGEPITYPRINEVCEEFHRRGISTFIVTNAQYPDAIKNLKLCTQLYCSIDAPNKQLLKEIDKPLFSDYWERFEQSLIEMSKKSFRKTVRLTHIKGLNDIEPENYARLVTLANADFVEVKSYMHVGASKERLQFEHMPLHDEVEQFAQTVLAHLPEYELVTTHPPSRAVLLAKKTFAGKTWIDYPRFHELATTRDPATVRVDEYINEKINVKEYRTSSTNDCAGC